MPNRGTPPSPLSVPSEESSATAARRRSAQTRSNTRSRIPRPVATERGNSRSASRPLTDLLNDPTSGAASERRGVGNVRRSPQTRDVDRFDPEMLRDELVGTFPGPAERSDEPSEPDEERSPTSATISDRRDSPSAEASVAPPTEPTTPIAESHQESTTGDHPAPHWYHDSELSFSASDDDARAVQSRPPAEANDRDGGAADDRYGTSPPRPANPNRAAAKAFRGQSAAPPDRVSRRPEPSAKIVPPRDGPQAPAREPYARSRDASGDDSAVLVENQAPLITSDIRGPKQIMIGREATYQIRLHNQGTVAAEELEASIRVPSWAEVVESTATRGVIRHTAGTEAAAALTWEIPQLEAGASQTLHLRLIPRGSRPLELGVTWAHAPVASRAIVEVQEPKLEMHVTGPDEVLFGKSYIYRLSLSNPGTGIAENVRIELMPLGGGRPVSTQQMGDLGPGASRSVEVELTAREAGKLRVEAVATADGGLKSQSGRDLFCRKPELEVDWRGPQMQYAGTTATYFFRARNPGTASADDVAVRVLLPMGAQFIGASEGHVHNAARGEVAWRVGSLGPGDDRYMELRCKLNTPGENRMSVAAVTASGDLTAVQDAATNVVALADLTLDVNDPPGPVLVGDDAVYEIRVENRGASAAEEVNVVALFSGGLEPQTIEGSSYKVSDGRVTFRTISKLPAGQHAVLRIRARAIEPGTHVFRAEVLCRDLDIKLAAEETTRFYDNELAHQPDTSRIRVGNRETDKVR